MDLRFFLVLPLHFYLSSLSSNYFYDMFTTMAYDSEIADHCFSIEAEIEQIRENYMAMENQNSIQRILHLRVNTDYKFR